MANLTVSIYVRLKTGNGPFIPATGKNDPRGSYYIQPRQQAYRQVCWEILDEAYVAKPKLEWDLKILAVGGIVPEETPAETKKEHRISDVIAKYLADLAAPDQNGEYTSKKSLNSKRSELEEFAQATGKTYVEEINLFLTHPGLPEPPCFVNGIGPAGPDASD